MNKDSIGTAIATPLTAAPFWLPHLSAATEVVGFIVGILSLAYICWNLIDKWRGMDNGPE